MTADHIQVCLERQAALERAGSPVPRLGSLLVEAGVMTEAEITAALARQRARSDPASPADPAGGGPEPAPGADAHAPMQGDPDFSSFAILETLGHDPQRVTYKARHKPTDALVLLRVQTATGARHSGAHAFFATHARAAKRLRHPHLQRVLAVGHVGEQHFYAAEYIEGVSLRRLLDTETRLSWPWVARIGSQLARALAACHAEDFVHCELRPSNIVITREGAAKLSGFGASLHMRSHARQIFDPAGGSPVYVAPEQTIEDGPVDSRTDLFSLGATLYHALTGRPPFSAPDFAHMRLALLQDQPADPLTLIPGLPPFFSTFLSRLLAIDPDRRYARAADVATDLESLLPESDRTGPDVQAYQTAVLERLFPRSHAVPSEHAAPASRSPRPRMKAILRVQALPLAALLVLSFGVSWAYRRTQEHRAFLTRADELYQAGDLRRAVRYLQEAARVRPGAPDLARRLVGVAEEYGDFAAAEAGLRQLLDHQDPPRVDDIAHLGDLLAWQDQHAQAARIYRRALARAPDRTDLRYKLADALQWAGRYSASAAAFRSILEGHPNGLRAQLGLARSCFYGHDHAAALRAYERYLAARPQETDVLFEYAESLAGAARFADAAAIYGRFAERNPDSRTARLAQARNLLWAEAYDEAIPLLQALHQADPADPEVLRSLALARQGTGDLERTITCYEKLRQLLPRSVAVPQRLARLYQGAQRFDEAARAFAELSAAHPDDPDLLLGWARSRAWAGQPGRAVAPLRKALQIRPDDVALEAELARLLLWADKPDEARPLLERLVASGRADPQQHLTLARIYLAGGGAARARALLQTIPADRDLDAEALFALAQMEIQAGTPADRLQRYEAWLATHPDDWTARRRFAALLRAAGRHDKAWPLYAALAERFPQDQSLLFEAAEEAGWAGHPQAELRILEQLNELQQAQEGDDR